MASINENYGQAFGVKPLPSSMVPQFNAPQGLWNNGGIQPTPNYGGIGIGTNWDGTTTAPTGPQIDRSPLETSPFIGNDISGGLYSTLGSERAINSDRTRPIGPRETAMTAIGPKIGGQGIATTPPPGAIAPPTIPTVPPVTTPSTEPLSAMNQSWMDQNKGNWGEGLMNFMRDGGGNDFKLDPMNIQWRNGNTGELDNMTRALGIIQGGGGGDALAKILGGTFVDSPLGNFGSNQKDKFIRMPNGQMIDASVLANSLSGASKSSNPFASLSDVINLYQSENKNFNQNTSTNAIDLVNTGKMSTTIPTDWSSRTFSGGPDPTYQPTGPVPGNPGNPGLGTGSGGLWNPPVPPTTTTNPPVPPTGPPVPPTGPPAPPVPPVPPVPPLTNTQPPTGGGTTLPPPPPLPSLPITGGNTQTAESRPRGLNTNSNYYLNNGFGGRNGSAGGGVGGGASRQSAMLGGRPGGENPQLSQPAPASQWAGTLANGAKTLGK